MSEQNDQTEKTVRTGARKPLTLQKTVESGHVRQNFSHGRSKSVVVEKKRTRKLGPPGADHIETPVTAAPAAEKPQPQPPRQPTGDAAPSAEVQRARPAQRILSEAERKARDEALAAARAGEAQRTSEIAPVRFEPVRPPEPETPPAPATSSEAVAATTQPETAAPAPAVEAQSEAQTEATPAPTGPERTPIRRDHREGGRAFGPREGRPAGARPQNPGFMPREGGRPREIELPTPRRAGPAPAGDVETPKRPQRTGPATKQMMDDEEAQVAKRGAGVKVPRPAVKLGEDRSTRTKITITNFDREAQQRSLASLKRKREKEKAKAMGLPQTREKITREVTIPEAITIQELSNRMTERAVDIIKYLMKQGAMHKITDVIDADTAELIVQEFGHTAKRVSEADVEIGFVGDKDVDDRLEPRAPVVTIMGHVDHGKTSLLDAIRSTNVVSGEAGGITQHIGAYQVKTADGDKITFIDTPGHEAFTLMRARGAEVTDIVILVVAATEGIMPQTVEAINHAKAAEVPIIVAINKCDLPDANPQLCRQRLMEHGLVPEDFGGETICVNVSALKGTGLDQLLEMVALQADVLELRADPARRARGIVLEAQLDKGRGPVATVLVQDGTLKQGDAVVVGTAYGRVRAMENERGQRLPEAPPSTPVQIIGLSSVPEAGQMLHAVENERAARDVADHRAAEERTRPAQARPRLSLDELFAQADGEGPKELRIVLKADVHGSAEAVRDALLKQATDTVKVNVILSGVGAISESDVMLAKASDAIVVGFHVRPDTAARRAAEGQGVDVRSYQIIYELTDEVRQAMAGLLPPKIEEKVLGRIEVRKTFNVPRIGTIAGCYVTEGMVRRNAKARLLRDGVQVWEGGFASLKRFKDDVREVQTGFECGIGLDGFNDVKVGDVIEPYEIVETRAALT